MGNEIGNKLEPPRLGFRRKKKAEQEPAVVAERTSHQPPQTPTDRAAREAEPKREAERRFAPKAAGEQSTAQTRDREPAPSPKPEPTPSPEPGAEATQVLPSTDSTPTTRIEEPVADAAHPKPTTPRPRPPKKPKPVAAEPKPRVRREPLMAFSGHPAAAVSGLAVGLFMVLAIWACEAVSQASRGTTSLGRAGFPLLIAIFILAVVIGALLLRFFDTPSPGSASFLGTGLVAVLAILFLSDRADSAVGAVVVVVLAIASFVLARWVSVRYIGD